MEKNRQNVALNLLWFDMIIYKNDKEYSHIYIWELFNLDDWMMKAIKDMTHSDEIHHAN